MLTQHPLGKADLAAIYFPHLQKRSAWVKLRTLLLECPELQGIATMSRRTLTISEVEDICSVLGEP